MKTSTENFVERVSTVTTPNKDLQAAAMMLGDAAARVDAKFVKRGTILLIDCC